MQIGDLLREAREEQGLSLDDIQELTKIQKRYLVAIEHDDFHALPGRFYARAFIKEYAQAVGLDPLIVLSDFDEETIQDEQEENIPYNRFDRSRRTEEKNSSVSSFLSFLPTIIVVILVIGTIFVAYTLLQKSSTNSGEDVEVPQENDEIVRKKDNEQNSDDSDETSNDDEEEAGDDEKAEDNEDANHFEVTEVGEGNSPLSTIDYTYSGDEVIVSLDPTADTYVQILNGNEQNLFEGSLTESTTFDDLDVSDEERIYFNIGNASGLNVTINGEQLEYPVDANEKVHQKMWINLKKAD